MPLVTLMGAELMVKEPKLAGVDEDRSSAIDRK